MDYPFPHQTKEVLKRFGMLPYQSNLVLNSEQVQQLQEALIGDAQSYLYNGIISFGAAVQSIGAENYGWAIVKLYYSVFYLARAKLAIGQQVTFVYDGKKPYLLSLSSKDILQLQTGNYAGSTHKLILHWLPKRFQNSSLVNSLVSKGSIPVLEWLMKQRECANYNSARMPDPEPPKILKKIVETDNINEWLKTYKHDSVYVTDEEHVCLAYPFLLIIDILQDFKNRSVDCYILRDNLDFIETLLVEDKNKSLEVLLYEIRNAL
ncbi:MAG: hypothetical protein R3E08_12450 [Thiotrichaceae bacterium]